MFERIIKTAEKLLLPAITDFAESVKQNIREQSELIISHINTTVKREIQNVEHTISVCILSKTNDGQPTMAAKSIKTDRRGHQNKASIYFQPELPIPSGSWIVVIGLGRLTHVQVGNWVQSHVSMYDAPICITKDECRLGERIIVTVEY